MSDEKIKVISYSGYRDEERPKIFILYGEKIKVLEILSTWIEEKLEDRARRRFFKVKGSDGHIHKIYYNEKTKEWRYAMKSTSSM
jgi:hypothetical protein